MKYLALLLLLALPDYSTFQERGQWVIHYNSQLLIHGRTNINNFTCQINCYTNVDTLVYSYHAQKRMLVFSENSMEIPVYNFNCGNPLITKDFRHTVKASRYPYLQISFLSLEGGKTKNVKAMMEISLAGVTREVPVVFDRDEINDLTLLKGVRAVCFSDFGMEAPARMMGLVKVQEDLTVEFNLLIKSL